LTYLPRTDSGLHLMKLVAVWLHAHPGLYSLSRPGCDPEASAGIGCFPECKAHGIFAKIPVHSRLAIPDKTKMLSCPILGYELLADACPGHLSENPDEPSDHQWRDASLITGSSCGDTAHSSRLQSQKSRRRRKRQQDSARLHSHSLEGLGSRFTITLYTARIHEHLRTVTNTCEHSRTPWVR